MHVAGTLPLSDLYTQLIDLCQQLSDCLNLWSSYFTLTQTRFYLLSQDCTCHRAKFTPEDQLKHERHLAELHETNYILQSQHQQAANRLLEHYLDRATEEELLSNLVPYVDNEKADGIFIGISALHYSITQLARATLALGMNIHSIFELETTHLYRAF